MYSIQIGDIAQSRSTPTTSNGKGSLKMMTLINDMNQNNKL